MLQSLHLNKVGVSKCLVGEKCRYDGEASKNIEALKGCLTFCPEMLGGLTVPRIPCSIVCGNGDDVLDGKTRIIGSDGKDYTNEFVAGAQKTVKFCLENGINTVILKEKSPSCGVRNIYNGKNLVKGYGVTTALLKRNGIKTISDMEVSDEQGFSC